MHISHTLVPEDQRECNRGDVRLVSGSEVTTALGKGRGRSVQTLDSGGLFVVMSGP